MPAPSSSDAKALEAIVARVQSELVVHRGKVVEEHRDAALTASILPFWTQQIAEAVALPEDFPRLPFVSPRGNDAFEMRAEYRTELLKQQLSLTNGRGEIRARIVELGKKLAPSSESGARTPLEMWATLAAVESPKGAADVFTHQIEELFAKKAETALPPADVFNWINAATPLAELLGRLGDTWLYSAIQQAGRRVELTEREIREKARLERYLTRTEHDRAFQEFLTAAESGVWALHFIGAGATGKTMLLRHIAWELAGDSAHTRIDFDLLSPDFPRVAPGMLLWALAKGLRAFAKDDRTIGMQFDKADELFNRVRASATGDGSAVDHPDFASGLKEYGQALHLLSNNGKRKVVLILDTCEELTRHQSDGGSINVRETFRILEGLVYGRLLKLDEAISPGMKVLRPWLRVVFSGRQLLASDGINYANGATKLPPRWYLKLHEIRGFTKLEALDYLTHQHPVPPEYVDVILARSPDLGSVVRVEWPGAGGVKTNEQLYSPFDLNDLATWVNSDVPPTVEEVRDFDSSKYVELRVLRRIAEAEVKQVLPIVATAGHYDEAFLHAATELSSDVLKRVIAVLDRQEWTNSRIGPVNLPVWTVEPILCNRMAQYFATKPGWEQDRARAMAYLAGQTILAPLNSLDWTVLDANFRLLADFPETMAGWWWEFESRVKQDSIRGWVWLRDALRFVVELWAPKHGEEPAPCWAFIAGAYAGALQRTPDLADKTKAGEWWERVVEHAHRFPIPAVAANLKLRGLALAVADLHFSEPAWTTRFWAAIRECDPGQLDILKAGSLLVGLRSIVSHVATQKKGVGLLTDPTLRELLDLAPDTSPKPELDWRNSGAYSLLTLMNRLADQIRGTSQKFTEDAYRQIQAVNCILQGQLQLLLGLGRGAGGILADAAGFARMMSDSPPDEATGDLFLPPDLKSEIFVECITLLYPQFGSCQNVISLLGGWLPTRPSLQADRLLTNVVSLYFRMGERARAKMPPMPEMEVLAGDVTNTQAELPQLFITLMETSSFLGNGDVGMNLWFLSRTHDVPSVEPYLNECVRAHTGIALRFRLFDEGYREIIRGYLAPRGLPLYQWPLWFASQQYQGNANPDLLDDSPIYLFLKPVLVALRGEVIPAAEVSDIVRHYEAIPETLLERLGLLIQAEAFGAEFHHDTMRQLAEQVGIVMAADQAMMLAEVLNIRRPEIASRLYQRAATWYVEAEHHSAAFAASLFRCLADPHANRDDIAREYEIIRTNRADQELPTLEMLVQYRGVLTDQRLRGSLPVPKYWWPLLTRWMVLLSRGTDWEAEMNAIVLEHYGRRSDDNLEPPPDLARWVPARPRPIARPGEIVIRLGKNQSPNCLAIWRHTDGIETVQDFQWALAARQSEMFPRVFPGFVRLVEAWRQLSTDLTICFDVWDATADVERERQITAYLAHGASVNLRYVTNGRVPSRRFDRTPKLQVLVHTGGNSYHHGMAEDGWRPVQHSGGDVQMPFATPFRTAPTPNSQVRVLHLIGTPIGDDGRGRRVQVSGRGATNGQTGHFSDVLLTDIPLDYPNLLLCVLQLPPALPNEQSLVNEDDEHLFREFAHELFSAGVPAVVALPCLHHQEAVNRIRDLAVLLANPSADPVGTVTSAVGRRETSPVPNISTSFLPCVYVDREWTPWPVTPPGGA